MSLNYQLFCSVSNVLQVTVLLIGLQTGQGKVVIVVREVLHFQLSDVSSRQCYGLLKSPQILHCYRFAVQCILFLRSVYT